MQTRTFTQKGQGHGKNVLSTWAIGRCACGRFLSKFQHKQCSKCRKDSTEVHTLQKYRTNPEFREEQKLRCFVRRHADAINIGDMI